MSKVKDYNIFICECHSFDHMLIVWKWTKEEGADEDMVFVEVHLSHYLGFFTRLKKAFWYVLGRRSKTGDFAEFIISQEDRTKLKKLL